MTESKDNPTAEPVNESSNHRIVESSKPGRLAGLVTALRTLTIIPVPGSDAHDMARALPWFPLIGAFIGLVVAVTGWVVTDLCLWPTGAGVLACGLSEAKKLTLLVDVGTNGEIVVGNREWMAACSASAGPAFEGSGLSCGMRAQAGAIQVVKIDQDLDVKLETIGGEKHNCTVDFHI